MPLFNPSTGFANPMTTEGEMIIGRVAGVPTRLALGAETDVLTAGAATAAWAAGGGGGGVTVFQNTMDEFFGNWDPLTGNGGFQAVCALTLEPGSYVLLGTVAIGTAPVSPENDVAIFNTELNSDGGTVYGGAPFAAGSPTVNAMWPLISLADLAEETTVYLTVFFSASTEVTAAGNDGGTFGPYTQFTAVKYA